MKDYRFSTPNHEATKNAKVISVYLIFTVLLGDLLRGTSARGRTGRETEIE